MDKDPIIKIENLNVVYNLGKSNQVHALKDINLEIFPGEFIIFFGPSGCGKSTLLYALAGLERNITGNVFFSEENITQLADAELELFHQKKVGMIFQAYYLIHSLSIVKNVALPQIFTSRDKQERLSKARDLLKSFGVINQADKMPNELSGGQQQRVAIARALINEPEVILADEPVGNLDSKSSLEVLELLKTLNTVDKKTIILVTHNAEHLVMADRIFYIKDGFIEDIKVNKTTQAAAAKAEEEKKPEIPRDLELIIRTFSSLSASQIGTMLIPFKAKQIISEVLTDLTMEEVSKIEKQTEALLTRGLSANEDLLGLLDKSVEENCLGLNKQRAVAITGKVKEVVEEIKRLEEMEMIKKQSGYQAMGIDAEAIQIRQYLFDLFDISISSFDNLEIIDKAINDRLTGKIDAKEYLRLLDQPAEDGGAGMDKRTARKLSKRLELLILGKYK